MQKQILNSPHKKFYCILFFALLLRTGFSQIVQRIVEEKADITNLVNDEINKLPVSFRKNMGQWDEKILYQGFSPGWNANINFLKDGLSFGVRREAKSEKKELDTQHHSRFEVTPMEHLVWNLHFKGMSSNVSITSEGQQDSHINYLIGNDVSKHNLNVPDYRRINYKNAYDNIDVSYYSTGKNIKYDFILNPGADIHKIQMNCEGINNIRVNKNKQLEITNEWGTLIEEMPESYQIINGTKILVSVEYVALSDNTFGFKINGNYDKSQTLIIDPVILEWGTFCGASGVDEGYCYAVAVDPAGNVYCTGFYEANFPITAGAYGPTYQFQQDAFVFKLTPNAATLIYATYLGGSSPDWGYGIVANAAGEAYITGRTASANFPTTVGAYQTTFAGGNGFDVFVTKLNPTGTAAVYSTFIGGTQDDEGYDIKINPAGEVFITGVGSTGYPVTAGAFQTTLPAGYGALITKLNAAGNALVYSGLLGGSLGNYGYGIAIDPSGNAYVTGETGAWANTPPTYTDFPLTPGAFDMNYGNCGWKGFITKINAAGTAMVYSSLLGGQGNCPQTGADVGRAVAVNAAGEAFVAGNTGSQNLYTSPGAADQTYNGAGDVFVIRLNASGTAAIYSTFYGGSMGDIVCGIAVNSTDEAFISGYTETDDGTFPITSCAYQPLFGGQSTATIRGDIFVAKFNALGTTLQYSTFVGGNSDDYQIPKIVLFGACEEEVIVNGTSHSANFPTTPGVFQPTKLNGGQDQPVVFKMKPDVKANFTWTKPPCSMTVTFTDSSYGNCNWQAGAWSPTSWNWNFGDGSTSTQQNPVHTYTAYGTYSVTLVVACPKDSITIPITISNTSGSVSGNTTLCNGNSTTLTATGGTNYSWSTGATTSSISITPSASTNYTVIISSGSCADTIPINVLVSNLTLNSSVTPVTCNGNNNGTATITASGGSSPYTYSWSPSGGTNATASGLSAGNYTVTVSDASGGCASTQTINISQPTALTTSLSSTPDVCGGNSGTATVSAAGGTGSYTYLWNPSSAASATATGLAAGNYSITVTDANGCTLSDTITVASTATLAATATNATICLGQNAILSASGGINYSWSNGSIASSIIVSPSTNTTYSVIVSAGSCSDTASATVTVNPTPTATAWSSVTITQGQSATLSAGGGGTYLWSSGAIDSNISVSPLITTWYCVSVSNGNCTDTACVTVYVEPLDCGYADDQLFVPDAFSPNGDTKNDVLGVYYPNISCIKEFMFIIYDRWGEKVFEAEEMSVLWDGTYKGRLMNTAVFVYYMKAELITGEKIIKKGNISLIR